MPIRHNRCWGHEVDRGWCWLDFPSPFSGAAFQRAAPGSAMAFFKGVGKRPYFLSLRTAFELHAGGGVWVYSAKVGVSIFMPCAMSGVASSGAEGKLLHLA